jgi:hypothetical protein
MGLKNNQDWRNVYILPFKTMAIMASSIVPLSFIKMLMNSNQKSI